MATTAETLALVDGLAKIMRRRNCDLIDVDPATGRIKIVKSMHDPAPMPPGEASDDDEEELATWSSDA